MARVVQNPETFINKVLIRGYMQLTGLWGSVQSIGVEFSDNTKMIVYGTLGHIFEDPWDTRTDDWGIRTIILSAPMGFDEMRLGLWDGLNIKSIALYRKGVYITSRDTEIPYSIILKSSDIACGLTVLSYKTLAQFVERLNPISGLISISSIIIVNGGLSDWGDWSECLMDIGEVTSKTRTKTCTNPKPYGGGTNCGIIPIDRVACEINGGWTNWTDWSTCSRDNNGSLRKTRTRKCTNPTPSKGGIYCIGDSIGTELCPVNGGLSDWVDLGICSGDYYSGDWGINQTKICNNPTPENGGNGCTIPFRKVLCPIDGGVGNWGRWDSLCLPGELNQTRTRLCNNPNPMNGGADCNEPLIDTKLCPVHGGLSAWSDWGACSPDANGVLKRRMSRTCTNPVPSLGGRDCGELPYIEQECPIDGGWSDWGEWSRCYTTDDTNTHYRQRTRDCNNPLRQYFGKDCIGDNEEVEICKIDGGLNPYWTDWSECSPDENGILRKTRTKLCNNPEPSGGGADCETPPIETKFCPINGGIGDWGEWSECLMDVDGALKKTRSRLCNNPTPAYGGADCTDSLIDTKFCPIDGGLSDWGTWGECLRDVDGVWRKTRSRECNKPTPAYGGADCIDSLIKQQLCPGPDISADNVSDFTVLDPSLLQNPTMDEIKKIFLEKFPNGLDGNGLDNIILEPSILEPASLNPASLEPAILEPAILEPVLVPVVDNSNNLIVTILIIVVVLSAITLGSYFGYKIYSQKKEDSNPNSENLAQKGI